MTEFEKQCYGMSEADIREQYMDNITARVSGLEMVVMGILSDCQELTTFANSTPNIRRQLNVAKYILSDMMDKRQSAESKGYSEGYSEGYANAMYEVDSR